MSYRFCPSPFTTVNINPVGAVVPCLCGAWHNFGSIGDLNHNTFQEIFNSDRIREFQQSTVDQTYKHCHRDHCGNFWNLETVNKIKPPEYQLPTTVLLAIDQNCNLKCASCRSHNIFSKDINPQAKVILDRLITDYQDYPGTVEIQCDGYGDIFASATYQEFFRNTDLPKCFRFTLITNGNLITKNVDWLERLADKIDTVEISFDAATAETYKEVRGGNFNSIVDGVGVLKDLGITARSQFVVQQKNYREILDYRQLAKDLGINWIGYQHLMWRRHMTKDWWESNRLENNPAVDYNFLVPALLRIKADDRCGLSGELEKILSKSYR